MERPDRTKEIFIAALPVPPGERRAWLEQNCGGDAELLSHVQSLLEAHDKAGSFLADAGGDVRCAAAATVDGAGERVGETIGAYKLLESIGEGGFGTVWMAEQREPVRRLVALKVLKAGMDSAQVVARFEQERQALALMTHPNIAQVFDAGTTPRGLPFFVMELVKGVPVTDYCAREKLPIRARLDLFVQVCRAVQHAHGKGLIHRDIKPRNVLVATADGKPLAKVIDFGIAKATAARLTDKTLFTEHRAMVGTLEYMSPEQAQGLLDVDTRSDVYSLGALLYELLTGSTPFDAKELVEAGYAEILRILRDVEPQRPSVRVSTKGAAGWVGGAAVASQRNGKELFGVLRGELDWVVMKALEKDRTRRYASADGLAEDVERYLAGDPVRAVPPSVGYRVRKFVRRNKSLVVSGIVVIASLAGGVAAAVWAQQKSAGNERSWRELAEGMITAVKLTPGMGDTKKVDESLRQFRYSDDPEGNRNLVESAVGFLQGAISVSFERLEVQRDVERINTYAARLNGGLAYANAGFRELATASFSRCAPDVRGWEFRFANTCLEDGNRVWAKDAHGSALCADGDHCAYWNGSAVRVVRSGEWTAKTSVDVDVGDARVTSLHFPSSRRLVVATDGPYFVVDPTDSTVRRGFDCRVVSSGVVRATNADATRVATSDGKKLAVWDVDSGAMLREYLDDEGARWSFSYDGQLLAAVTTSGGAPMSRIWRLSDGVRVFAGSGDIAMNPFGPLCLSSLGDVVDIRTGTVRHVSELANVNYGYCDADLIVVSSDRVSELDRALNGFSFQSAVRVCSLIDGRETTLPNGFLRPDARLPITPDLARGFIRYPDSLWGWTYVGGDPDTRGSGWAPIFDLGVSYDGKWLIGSSTASPARPLGNVRAGSGLLVLATSGSSTRPLVIGRSPKAVCAYDAFTGALKELPSPDVALVTGDQDGKHFLERRGGELVILNAADLQSTSVLATDAGDRSAIALSHDGSIAAACDSKSIQWWNVASPRASRRIPLAAPLTTPPVLAVHGNSIALGQGHTVHLFSLDADAPPMLRKLEGDSVTCIMFEPNGARLLVGTTSGLVRVLTLPGLWPTVEMSGHVGAVTAVTSTADGDRVFTAGADGTVRVWHARPPEMPGASTTAAIELLSLSDPEITGKPTCLLFPPDGERLICGYDDGSIRVWDSVPWSERVDRRNAAVGWPVQKK